MRASTRASKAGRRARDESGLSLIEAVVAVTLFSTDGAHLATYQLRVGPGEVVQDLQPFVHRAARPDLGWGFAEVNVLFGSDVLCSASVVDSRTNDATTVPMQLGR